MLRKELAADRLERHVGALIGVSCVARVAAPITPRVSVLRRGARGGAHNPTRRYGRHNPTLLTQVIRSLRPFHISVRFTFNRTHFTSPLATLSQHVHSRHMLAHASCGCATRVTAMRTGRHRKTRHRTSLAGPPATTSRDHDARADSTTHSRTTQRQTRNARGTWRVAVEEGKRHRRGDTARARRVAARSDAQDLQLLVEANGDPVGLSSGPLQLVHLRLSVVGEYRVGDRLLLQA